jgi:hypothetical protein
MSALVSGLSVAGAFAGAAIGWAFTRPRMGSLPVLLAVIHPKKTIAATTLAGASLFGGAGWLQDGGVEQIQEHRQKSSLANAAEDCIQNTPKNSVASFTAKTDGTGACVYTPR